MSMITLNALVVALKKIVTAATTTPKAAALASVALPLIVGTGVTVLTGPLPDTQPLIFVAGPGKAPVLPTPTPTPTPTPAPASSALSSKGTFNLGVNVTGPAYWTKERSFANLVTGGPWLDNWAMASASQLDAEGNVSVLKDGQVFTRILTPPAGVLGASAGVTIRCTWTGTASMWPQGSYTQGSTVWGDHAFEFAWPSGNPNPLVWVELHGQSATDPVRNLDCREKEMDRAALFAPEFLASLKPYGVLRFMEWGVGNQNPAKADLVWANRVRATSSDQTSGNVAYENMVALANQVGSDAWFNVPWQADAAYVTAMAQSVHDGMDAKHHVYVEVANEVWNGIFTVSGQAQKEGLDEKLSDDPFGAQLLRYAERTREVMAIWARVFADHPGQLVRVAAMQHNNPWTGGVVLGAKDTANYVDALATAPYFGDGLLAVNTSSDITVLLGALADAMNGTLDIYGAQNLKTAQQYGKRYIAYEAGAHLIEQPGKNRIADMERADQMYTIYKAYLTKWKTMVNDTMVLYQSTAPIGTGGFGLREYAGQPLDQTPKRRAAIEMGSGG